MKGLLFTYALTYGGAAVSLLSPFYGFLVYVAFANLKPESLWFWSVPQGNYSRIVAVAFLIGWLLHGGGSWRFGRATSMIVALGFFWAWIILGFTITPELAKEDAWLSLTTLSKVFLPVIAGVTLIDSVPKLKLLAWVLVMTQGYLALEFNQQYYAGGFDPMFWQFAGLDNNGIAVTMVTSFGLAGFLGLHADRWWQRLIALAAAALMAHVILFSMSRGAMLAMCITGAVAFWLIPKRPVHFAMLIVALLVIARLAGPQVREEFFSAFAEAELRDTSAQSRIDLTIHNLQEMMKNPLFGCGMDNWPNIAPQYGWQAGKEGHNLWAQTGAELGIPGLVSLLGFYVLGCWKLLPVARESTPAFDPWLRYFARMVIAAAAGYVVAAAAVSIERVELPYYIMALGAGTLKLHSLGLVPAVAAPAQLPHSTGYSPAAAWPT